MGLEVHKYRLSMVSTQRLQLCGLVKPMAVQKQGDDLCLWMIEETDPTNQYRRSCEVEIRGTGQPLDFPFPLECYDYVGTAQLGKYVWHVWILE